MVELKDNDIRSLIVCPKSITTAPQKRMTLGQGHYRNGMVLLSVDGNHRFSVFMRKSEMFEENFSIGLRYHPPDDPESLVLLRCNGPHGGHRDPLDIRAKHYWEYHIHVAREIVIKQGLREEAHADITSEYSNFNDALAFFLRYCNIKDSEQYFPQIRQLRLFDE